MLPLLLGIRLGFTCQFPSLAKESKVMSGPVKPLNIGNDLGLLILRVCQLTLTGRRASF